MKPDWDSLAETYAGSSSVVIADVDCTTDGGKEACSRFAYLQDNLTFSG